MISAMKRVIAVLAGLFLCAWLQAADEPKLNPLPVPVSNNAVAMALDNKDQQLFSFMGIGPKKTWDAITTAAYRLDMKTGKWSELRPVPGVVGRLAASAVAFHEQIFIFGGYVVAGDGTETTLPDLNVYVPLQDRYYRGADIPTPVDDSVIGVYRERYIYLVGGRSKMEGVHNVQVYDTDKDRWTQATPMPGAAVFGHAGGLVGDTIVYVDGAYRNPDTGADKYLPSDECWMGKINKHDVSKIEWTKLSAHPGNARYRIAAGWSDKENRIFFSGGAEFPYNYQGIGYKGQAAEPSSVTFAFNVRKGQWETIDENTAEPTMDHRGLLVTGRGLIMAGGMEKGQQVTSKLTIVKSRPGK